MVRARHVRWRGEHEVGPLVHKGTEVPSVAMDQATLVPKPRSCDLDMVRDELDADRAPPEPSGDGERRPVPRERIEHQVAGIGRVEDHRLRERLGEVDVVVRPGRPLPNEIRRAQHQAAIHAAPSAAIRAPPVGCNPHSYT
jgi:hypothetical protein